MRVLPCEALGGTTPHNLAHTSTGTQSGVGTDVFGPLAAIVYADQATVLPGAEKILIVDDDEALRQSLTEQLIPAKFTAVESRGRFAWRGPGRRHRRENFDGVILDRRSCRTCWMGTTSVRSLRQKSGLKGPIIVLTGTRIPKSADTIEGFRTAWRQ